MVLLLFRHPALPTFSAWGLLNDLESELPLIASFLLDYSYHQNI